MKVTPYVKYQDTHGNLKATNIDYEICVKYKGKYNVVESETYHNWVYELQYYCDKLIVSLIGSSILLGFLIGSLLSHYNYKLGSKNTMCLYGLLFSNINVFI